MDGAQQDGGGQQGRGSNLLGLGVAGVLLGLVILGCSFVAGRDADRPRCDGEVMSRDDVCLSTRSGAANYDERASDAQAASTWMLRIGGILTLAGAIAVGGAALNKRD